MERSNPFNAWTFRHLANNIFHRANLLDFNYFVSFLQDNGTSSHLRAATRSLQLPTLPAPLSSSGVFSFGPGASSASASGVQPAAGAPIPSFVTLVDTPEPGTPESTFSLGSFGSPPGDATTPAIAGTASSGFTQTNTGTSPTVMGAGNIGTGGIAFPLNTGSGVGFSSVIGAAPGIASSGSQNFGGSSNNLVTTGAPVMTSVSRGNSKSTGGSFVAGPNGASGVTTGSPQNTGASVPVSGGLGLLANIPGISIPQP